MAKGAEAKQKIANKLAEVFGKNWIGEYDKKYYIWSEENGERIQVAVSMTCPKNPIEIKENMRIDIDNDNENWDWENSSITKESKSNISVEITEEEKKKLAELMTKLGL